MDVIKNGRFAIPLVNVLFTFKTLFILVEEYKKKGNLDLYENVFEAAFLKATGQKQIFTLSLFWLYFLKDLLTYALLTDTLK